MSGLQKNEDSPAHSFNKTQLLSFLNPFQKLVGCLFHYNFQPRFIFLLFFVFPAVYFFSLQLESSNFFTGIYAHLSGIVILDMFSVSQLGGWATGILKSEAMEETKYLKCMDSCTARIILEQNVWVWVKKIELQEWAWYQGTAVWIAWDSQEDISWSLVHFFFFYHSIYFFSVNYFIYFKKFIYI